MLLVDGLLHDRNEKNGFKRHVAAALVESLMGITTAFGVFVLSFSFLSFWSVKSLFNDGSLLLFIRYSFLSLPLFIPVYYF